MSEINKDSITEPLPPERKRWMRAALLRGFYAAAQGTEAANLAITAMFPKTMQRLGINAITGGLDNLSRRVTDWEFMIREQEIEPAKPNFIKGVVSFALFNATYVLPLVIAGLAVQLVAGTMSSLIVAGILNIHSTMGEAFMQTAHKFKGDLDLSYKATMDGILQDTDFRKKARNNVMLKGGIIAAFTVAAGPIARFIGSFSGGAMRGLTGLPLIGYLSEQFLQATERSIYKSVGSSLGGIFANAVIGGGKGFSATVTAITALARGSTAWMHRRAEATETTAKKEPRWPPCDIQ